MIVEAADSVLVTIVHDIVKASERRSPHVGLGVVFDKKLFLQSENEYRQLSSTYTPVDLAATHACMTHLKTRSQLSQANDFSERC